MRDSNLLKEAIADAKAVRETALQNAKAVLEEAFAPKLQSMLSQKLQQEIDDCDTEELDEFENIEVSGTNVGKTGDAPHPLGLTDDDEIMNEDGTSGYAADDHTVDPQGASNELTCGPSDQDAKSTKTVNTSTEGPRGTGKLTTSKSDRSDVTAGNQRKASDQDANQTSTTNTSSELHIRENEDEDDLSAIIAELEGELDFDEENDGESLDFGDEDLDDNSEDTEFSDDESDELGDIELDNSDEVEGEESVGDISPVDVTGDEENEEDDEIDLEEILREMELGDSGEEDTEIANAELMKEIKSLRAENADYKKAFGYLKGKLNEVNLLNSKLLFTSKIFQNRALNNNQKMKVVEAFDRSRSVREVKLTYANLRESFDIANSGKKKSSITEGFASKVVSSTKPSQKAVEQQKQILAEGSEMAARLQKLAGIKK